MMYNLKCCTVLLPATDQTVMYHVPKFYFLHFVNVEIFGFDPYSINFPLSPQNVVHGWQYISYQAAQLLCHFIATVSESLRKFMKTIYFLSDKF